MRDELLKSLWRYDAMTGLVDWNDEDDTGREDKDRESFGHEYGLVRYPDGQDYVCNSRIVRFLVEVCGHSYDEAVEALVEHLQSQPHAYRAAPDAKADATAIRVGAPNIIEALFSLKLDRLVSNENQEAVDYSWRVTRTLMRLRNKPKFP